MLEVIGIDNITATIKLKKQAIRDNSVDITLKNESGSIYGGVKSKGKNAKLSINIPLLLHENNILPFTVNDKHSIEYIKNKLNKDLIKIFGDNISEVILSSVEIGVTKEYSNMSYVDNILRLLKLSYLDPKEQLLVWLNRDDNFDLEFEKTTGLLTKPIKGKYRVKAYNKSLQMLNDKKISIKENLFRLELIFTGKIIKQIYEQDSSLFNIIDNIDPLISVFKLKLRNDVWQKVREYLLLVENIMFERLTEGERPVEVFKHYRHLIVDGIQIKRVLKKYYKFKGCQDQSSANSKKIAKALKIDFGLIGMVKKLLKLKAFQ